MITVSLSWRSLYILMGAPNDCTEIVLRYPDRPGVPPEDFNTRIFEVLLAAPQDEGRETHSFVINQGDVEQLVRLLPAILEEFGDDDAECCARMDAWPEELEAAQAELLRALGR